MPFLMLKDLPRYDCLQEAAQRFPDLDPSACEVFLQLLRVGDELSTGQQAYLARHDISPGRFTVMMLLMRAGAGGACAQAGLDPCNPAELAGRAGVTRATMTGLIDTLEKDGYVRREPDPADRRMMSVQLTPEGEAFMHRVLPGYFRRIADVMENVTEAERRILGRLLNKVLAKASAMSAKTSSTRDSV